MDDREDSKDHLETSVSTPESTAGAPNEPKAPKDRTCPFCGQAFTSSSLGRHLDLYIKSKNPKPPDGVHNVAEIRKIRGGITRRHPRTSLKVEATKEDDERQHETRASSSAKRQRESNETSEAQSPVEAAKRYEKSPKLYTWLNAANWQATGVINDLPSRPPTTGVQQQRSDQTQRTQDMRNDYVGNRIERPIYDVDETTRLQESAEVGRAAEMALREVLGSLEAAKKRTQPLNLFAEFDFFKLAFPGLCLAMLPPPSSLFSSTPFHAAHTWALSPPGEQQMSALVRVLHERINAVRNGSRETVPEATAFRYRVHLDGAYEHWQTLSEAEQSSAWNLELSRAFVKGQEQKQQLKDDLDIAEQRIRHLEAEYDRLSQCQLPREYLLHPPNTIPIPRSVAREVNSSTLGGSQASGLEYDAEALLNKWRAEVKAVSRPHRPPSARPHYVETTRNQLKGDILLNGSVFGINGAMPRDADSMTRMNHPPETHEAHEASRNLRGVIGSDDKAEIEELAAEPHDYDHSVDNDKRADRRALTRLQIERQLSNELDEVSNSNGKRARVPSPISGRSPGPKMYKEQHK